MVIQWLSVFRAVQDHQLEGLRLGGERYVPKVTEWIERDDGGFRSLVLWNVAYRFMNGVFGAAVMADPPWQDRQLMEVRNPAGFATRHANVLVAGTCGEHVHSTLRVG